MDRPSFQWIKDKVLSKIGDLSTLSTTTIENIVAAINELFTSVGNGKTAVASAVTDKGVQTAPDATFAQMAANIREIPSGETIEDEPITITKNGVTAVPSGKRYTPITVNVSPPPTRSKLFTRTLTSVTTTSSWIEMVSADEEILAHKDDATLAVSWYALSAPEGASMLSGFAKASAMSPDGKYGMCMRLTSASAAAILSLTTGVRDGTASTGAINVQDNGAIRVYQNSSYKMPIGDYLIVVSW